MAQQRDAATPKQSLAAAKWAKNRFDTWCLENNIQIDVKTAKPQDFACEYKPSSKLQYNHF